MHRSTSLATATVRRRVFDIGSGSIKCAVAEVDQNNRITKDLFAARRQVLFLNGVEDTGLISQRHRDEGLDALHSMLQDTQHLNPEATVAVATEAFRKAANAHSVLEAYQDSCNIRMQIATHHQEARLGFHSAYATGHIDTDALVAWDCGAGSFQFTSSSETHIDQHGSGTVMKLAQQHAGVSGRFGGCRIDALLCSLKAALRPIPAWLRPYPGNQLPTSFIAIGSSHSIFNQMQLLSGLSCFQAHHVAEILAQVQGLNHSELFALEQACVAMQHGRDVATASEENAPYVVPKLALLLSVMRAVEMEEVTFYETNGNCAGMLADASLWSAPTQGTEECTGQHWASVQTRPRNEGSLSKAGGSDLDTTTSVFCEGVTGGIFDPSDLVTVNWHLEKECNYKE